VELHPLMNDAVGEEDVHKYANCFCTTKFKRDVAYFCRTWHICQVIGKPNQTIPVAPLKPIPACGDHLMTYSTY